MSWIKSGSSKTSLLPQTQTEAHSKEFNVADKPNLSSPLAEVFTWNFILKVLVVFLVVTIGCVTWFNTLELRKNAVGTISIADASCLLPIGGGLASEGKEIPMPSYQNPICAKIRAMYFTQNVYETDTFNAIKSIRFILDNEGSYKQMVVFDVDETVLSNLPFYSKFGYRRVTGDAQHQWQLSAQAPPIKAALYFYQDLRKKGFAVAFVTGRHESVREGTEKNLEYAGFGKPCENNPAAVGDLCYEGLYLRVPTDHRDAVPYKSEVRGNLEQKGFEIIASVGDQWSDLLGENRPDVVAKMPNPMYYLPEFRFLKRRIF